MTPALHGGTVANAYHLRLQKLKAQDVARQLVDVLGPTSSERVWGGRWGNGELVSHNIPPKHLILDQNGCFWPVLLDFKVATPVGPCKCYLIWEATYSGKGCQIESNVFALINQIVRESIQMKIFDFSYIRFYFDGNLSKKETWVVSCDSEK